MFEVDDINELYALQKGLMEIRFNATDVDWAVRGSPFLSRMHERLVDAIIAHHDSAGEQRKAQAWQEWRRFDTRILERSAIRGFLKQMWGELGSPENKREAVADQMRPFNYSEAEVTDMIVEIEDELSRK